MGTNSRAIRAACQGLEGDKKEGYLLPVRWAVVKVEVDENRKTVGHCAVTTAARSDAMDLVDKMQYI